MLCPMHSGPVPALLSGCLPATRVPDSASVAAGAQVATPVGDSDPREGGPTEKPAVPAQPQTLLRSPQPTGKVASAEPASLGNGLYRVRTIEVTIPGVPNQTLDVMMDQPNTEWAHLSLRRDDLNFDGRSDLVVIQPVGAKWGRLHAWLYDPESKQFVTSTLTSELGKPAVGNYRPDPISRTLVITNSLGMTPFEATYETVEGSLIPVFRPAVPTDAGACPAKAPGRLFLREERHSYCLL